MSAECDSDLVLASQDFKKLEATHLKAGYREGAAAGRDAVTEKASRVGLRGGLEAGLRWGRLRGRASGLEMSLQQDGRPHIEVSRLVGEVEEEEGRWRERKTARQQTAMEEQGVEEEDVRSVAEAVEGGRVSGELVRLEQKLEMLCKSYQIQR